MRKQYGDFTQLKLKDMSKSIIDMTYKYINSETQEPTVVPPQHYERILDQVQEQYLSDITSRQFLVIMYNQLTALKKEDEKYFTEALLCMDLGINPKDLRINEQIALQFTNDYIEDARKVEKKNHHFLRDDFVEKFTETRDDKDLQGDVIRLSNALERRDSRERDDLEL